MRASILTKSFDCRRSVFQDVVPVSPAVVPVSPAVDPNPNQANPVLVDLAGLVAAVVSPILLMESRTQLGDCLAANFFGMVPSGWQVKHSVFSSNPSDKISHKLRRATINPDSVESPNLNNI